MVFYDSTGRKKTIFQLFLAVFAVFFTFLAFDWGFLGVRISHTSVSLAALALPFFVFIAKVGLVFVVGRIVFILFFYCVATVRAKRRDGARTSRARGQGSISVIIPAYNEEANIEATLKSVLASTHLPREVIVVNDGSRDGTEAVVRSFAKKHSRIVKLISTENFGKAHALNTGISRARGKIIVALDADTIFTADAIEALTSHFTDRSVGAVAGKVYAIHSKKVLTVFQSLEYIMGQNVEKRALSMLNAIGVVPGAVGAWRKIDMIAVGGYSGDTLVEDQDLTLAILSSGKRIVFEPRAASFTEPPETFSDFFRQRFRWAYGSLQCFWKYRAYFFGMNGLKARGLSWFVLPNMLIYNILAPIFFPLLDLAFLAALLSDNYYNNIGYSLIAFTLLDIIYASISFIEENKTKRWLLVLIPFQRFFYRQLLYLIAIKSIIRALDGTGASWNKLARTGAAQAYFQRELVGKLVVEQKDPALA